MATKIDPFFSVIISTFNRAHLIERTIQSVLNQTFNDFEIIVVDDSSTDNTLEVIQKYNVRIFNTNKNSGGPAYPRNIGITKSSGKWICFLDSDDEFLPNHLEHLASIVKTKNLSRGIVSTNALINKKEDLVLEPYFKKIKKVDKTEEISFNTNFIANRCILSSMCIDNNTIKRFNENASVRSFEDYLFLLENMLDCRKHYFSLNPSIYYEINSLDSIRNKLKSEFQILFYKFKLLVENRLYTKIHLLIFCLFKLIIKNSLKFLKLKK